MTVEFPTCGVAGRERGGPGWRGGRFTGGGNSGKLIYPNLTSRLVIAKFVGMFCQKWGNSGKLICPNLSPRLVIARFVGMCMFCQKKGEDLVLTANKA